MSIAVSFADSLCTQAYELSVLTGTQVLLLVVSETGLVYTFTTPKLQPLVTKAEGKNLIQVGFLSSDVAHDGVTTWSVAMPFNWVPRHIIIAAASLNRALGFSYPTFSWRNVVLLHNYSSSSRSLDILLGDPFDALNLH